MSHMSSDRARSRSARARWNRPLRAGLAALLLGPTASWSAASPQEAPARLTASVAKVSASRHKVVFTRESMEILGGLDDLKRFIDAARSRDVVAVYLLYHPPFVPVFSLNGPDENTLRNGRLRAVYQHLQGWLGERGLEPSIIVMSNQNLLLDSSNDSVTVEVLARRR